MERVRFKGRWVLVTGASGGLGQELARRLAYDHGANLIVTARREARLQDLKVELESRAGIEVRVRACDLAKLADVDALLEEATRGPKLYAAILNAGVTHFGVHEALGWSDFEAMLHTNVTSVVRATNALVPHLEAHPGGALMLVSSMAGMMPIPYQTAYSATKAFLVHFGVGLANELAGRSVSITTFTPGGIATEMTSGSAFHTLRGWLAPPDRVAREALDAMIAREHLHVPGWPNRLAAAASGALPNFVGRRLAAAYRKALVASGHVARS